MSSLAKQRQSWLDLVSQVGPTIAENVSVAQVHTQGDKLQEAPYSSESIAALARELQTSAEPTEQAPIHSGDNLITRNPSKYTQYSRIHKYLHSGTNHHVASVHHHNSHFSHSPSHNWTIE